MGRCAASPSGKPIDGHTQSPQVTEGSRMRSNGSEPSSLTWRKSSYSSCGECVEVAIPAQGFIAVRDSKNPYEARLTYTANEWHSFIQRAKAGEFDSFS